MGVKKYWTALGFAFLAAALCAVSTATVSAAEPELTADQQRVYDRAARQLVAPCCWREPVSAHRSEASLEVRREAAALARAGRSERQILDAMKARYGERILIVPEGGKAAWLFWTPAAVLAAGLLTAALALNRWRKRHLPAGGAEDLNVAA